MARTTPDYKKISIATLARMMYLLTVNETILFSSSPYDMGLNWRLTLASLSSDPDRNNDFGLYYILYAPSCKNSSYFWDGLSGMASHEADDITVFLESQPYPEDRPDEDGKVYVKTKDWNNFLRKHPDLEYDKDSVADFSE